MSVDSNRDVGTGASQEILGKGVNLLHLREFVRSRFGEEAWEQIVADLKPAAKIVVERHLGGDIQRAREIGTFDLEASLNTVYRTLYKLGSPAFIIRMSALLWRSYFNVGRMVIETSGRGFAVARIEEFTPADEICCWDIFGSMVRGLELSGASSVSSTHTHCPLKGDPFMRYEARWLEGA